MHAEDLDQVDQGQEQMRSDQAARKREDPKVIGVGLSQLGQGHANAHIDEIKRLMDERAAKREGLKG